MRKSLLLQKRNIHWLIGHIIEANILQFKKVRYCISPNKLQFLYCCNTYFRFKLLIASCVAGGKGFGSVGNPKIILM